MKEQERYETQISRYLQRESEKAGHAQDKQREEFKEQIAKDKEAFHEQEAAQLSTTNSRSIKRKPDVPKQNARNFEEENLRMGVTNELDLLMSEPAEVQDMARSKMERGLIEYSAQQQQNAASLKGEKKKKEK